MVSGQFLSLNRDEDALRSLVRLVRAQQHSGIAVALAAELRVEAGILERMVEHQPACAVACPAISGNYSVCRAPSGVKLGVWVFAVAPVRAARDRTNMQDRVANMEKFSSKERNL